MCSCAMGCAEGIVKLLVFVGNVLFALGGLALVIVGVLYKLNISNFTEAIPQEYNGTIELAPILTIVVGSIIFVIAFFGCCGAIRESTCLLTTYAVILLIIFLLQVALGVFVFLQIKDKDTLRTKTDTELQKIFDAAKNGQTHSSEITNLIQRELKCCGTNNAGFWGVNIPESCYKTPSDVTTLYTTGCQTQFYDFIINSMNIIGITVLALSALEVLGCIMSLCLSSSIKNRERRFRY